MPKTFVADASAGLRSPTVSPQATFQFMSCRTSAFDRTRARPSRTHSCSMALVFRAHSVTSSR